MVDTKASEFDYPLDDQTSAVTTWKGTTGVGVGNLFSRLLFAMRFGDLNLLISNQLTGDSKILFRRDIVERVQELAPFLVYDNDPYLVSADGRLVWIWDAYTVSDRYPDAQPLTDVFPGKNYVRNSVKVVIDAYDGSVKFYISDPTDPIIEAYARIFPSLLEPLDSHAGRACRRTCATPRTSSPRRTRPTCSTTSRRRRRARRPSTTGPIAGRSRPSRPASRGPAARSRRTT